MGERWIEKVEKGIRKKKETGKKGRTTPKENEGKKEETVTRESERKRERERESECFVLAGVGRRSHLPIKPRLQRFFVTKALERVCRMLRGKTYVVLYHDAQEPCYAEFFISAVNILIMISSM